MKEMIGMFAKANVKGKAVFGMVDSVHQVPNAHMKEMLGFVFADPTQWTGCLVAPEDVTEVETPEEIAKAVKSARLYWSYEVTSLEWRINMKYEIDDQKKLAEMLQTAKDWLATLSK